MTENTITTTDLQFAVLDNIALNQYKHMGHSILPQKPADSVVIISKIAEYGPHKLNRQAIPGSMRGLIAKGLVERCDDKAKVRMTEIGLEYWRRNSQSTPTKEDKPMVKKSTTTKPKKSAESAATKQVDKIKADAAAKADAAERKAEEAAAKKAAAEAKAAEEKAKKQAERDRIAAVKAELKAGTMTPQQAQKHGFRVQLGYKGEDEALDPTYSVEIECEDCGESRWVKPQDVFQVKCCKPCQQIRKREKLNKKNREKRAAMKAAATA